MQISKVTSLKFFFFFTIMSTPSIGIFNLIGVPLSFLLPVLSLGICFVFYLDNLRSDHKLAQKLTMFTTLLILYLCFKIFIWHNISTRQILDLLMFYFIPLTIFSTSLRLNIDELRSVGRQIIKISFYLMIFGSSQFFLNDYLPDQLLKIPSTRGDATVNVISLASQLLIRPNMLIGTAMVVGMWLVSIQFLIFVLPRDIFSIRFYRAINLLILLLIVLNFSRIAIVVYVMIWFLYLWQAGKMFQVLKYGPFVAAGIVAILPEGLTRIILALFTRISMIGNSSDHSTSEHLEDYIKALDRITNFPFFGIRFGDAGDLITDGSIFHYLLDLGFFGVTVTLFPIFIILVAMLLQFRFRKKAIVFLSSFVGFIVLFSIANSALLARVNSTLVAFILAMLVKDFRANYKPKVN